jgi:hypothetical protein
MGLISSEWGVVSSGMARALKAARTLAASADTSSRCEVPQVAHSTSTGPEHNSASEKKTVSLPQAQVAGNMMLSGLFMRKV